MYRKELFKLHWAQGNGGRKPGCLPKVCFSWEGVSGGGRVEHNQPSETPSQDIKEIAMSRRLGPQGGRPQSHRQLQAHSMGAPRTEGMLCTQV